MEPVNVTTVTTASTTTATTIATTTTKKDECSITYCNNNGNCSYDTNNNKICKCNQNYSGNECESRLCEKDDSGYDQCSINGKCLFNIKTKQAYCMKIKIFIWRYNFYFSFKAYVLPSIPVPCAKSRFVIIIVIIMEFVILRPMILQHANV